MVDQEYTKTRAGLRDIHVPKRALSALMRQIRMQAEERQRAGPRYANSHLVFTTALGRPLSLDQVSRAFRKLARRLGLPGRLYDLRHSAASMMLALGVPAEVIAKRLGHKNISITIDTYGHLLPEANQEAARRLDAFLLEGRSGSTGDASAGPPGHRPARLDQSR
jgi:integrase